MKLLRSIVLTGAALVAIPAVYILSISRGKTKPFRNSKGQLLPGSVAEIKFLNINGARQALIIRGRDSGNPVLLYIHGGPGAPEYPFARQRNLGLEETFVVCYWEQRGAALSYSSSLSPGTMTPGDFVNDAAEVTRYLLRRFNQEKIYLLGHSWGTYLGALVARDYPQYFRALISTGQMSDQTRSETITYNHLLDTAKEKGHTRVLKKLTEIGPPPWFVSDDGVKKITIQRRYVTKYGGTIKHLGILIKTLSGPVFCREYRLSDKINYLRGIRFTLKNMLDYIMKANLFIEIPSLDIPVYILQGRSDYHTVYPLAREYFDRLRAPVKQFHSFEESAHAVPFEEPVKFNAIMRMIVSEHEKQNLLRRTLHL